MQKLAYNKSHSQLSNFIIILILSYQQIRTSSFQFIPDSNPSFGIDNLKYIIAINQNGKSENSEFEEGRHRTIYMTSSDNKKYKCMIPIEQNDDIMTEEENQISNIKKKTPFEYLESIIGLCYTRNDGWWVYQLCYKDKIIQYHKDDDLRLNSEYVLGKYKEEISIENEIKEGNFNGKIMKYVEQSYLYGDKCETTNNERITTVRYFCEEQNYTKLTSIMSVIEGPTCQYTVHVNMPLLCKHPEFKTKETTRVVLCDLFDNN